MSHNKYITISTPNLQVQPDIQITRIISKLFENCDKPFMVAVGGPGGVGKSTFAIKLSLQIEDSVVIRLDDYKIDRHEKAALDVSGPAPEANRMELLKKHLKDLKDGKIIEKPLYNRVTGTCDSIEEIKPASLIILDGEISTYKDFEKFIDMSLYVDGHWKTQLKTRTERDIDKRGYSVKKAISTFIKSNIEEYPEYGAGTKYCSDIQIWCDDNYDLTITAVKSELMDRFSTVLTRSEEEVSLEKLFVAVTTPFREDMSIDTGALAAHLKYLEVNSVNAVFLGGTTGEFETLTFAEKRELLDIGRKHFSGLITFNVSSTSLHESLELVKMAELGGANAVTALPPYYRADVGSEGISSFFNTISKSTSLPFIIYNFTRHTQNEITAELLHEIDAAAIKDSDKNLKLAETAPLYLCAGDSIIADAVKHGARGVVSVQGNYRPAEISKLFKISSEDLLAAESLQKDVAAVSELFRKTKQIARIKQALCEIIPGYPSYVRLPLVPLENDEAMEIIQWTKKESLKL